MNKTPKMLMALVAGLLLATLTGTGVGLASDGSSAATRMQQRVDAQLERMSVPARQTGYNTIRADDGTEIALGARGSGCDSGQLCLWAGDNYDHKKLVFEKCKFRDLSDYGFNDRLTSYKNYQTGHAESRFYNWSNGWHYQFKSVAVHKEADLGDSPWNNKIDAVYVC